MLNNSLNYIKQQLNGFIPDTALILGSGLDGVSQALENPIYLNYADIPDFPQTTVAGHKGRFAIGKIGRHNAYLSVDGGRAFRLNTGDVITTKASQKVTKLVRLKQRSFYDVCSAKFKK